MLLKCYKLIKKSIENLSPTSKKPAPYHIRGGMVQLDDGLATTTTIGPGEGLPLLPTAAALSFDQVGALPPSPSFQPPCPFQQVNGRACCCLGHKGVLRRAGRTVDLGRTATCWSMQPNQRARAGERVLRAVEAKQSESQSVSCQ